MRLWHEQLLSKLPRQQLLGQHRECCALRGNGWRKPHTTVNYVFNYAPIYLYAYHKLVMEEMTRRGYKVDERWWEPTYRGKACPPFSIDLQYAGCQGNEEGESPIYPEHNDDYLQECMENLAGKGIQVK
ncbi:TIGR02328 family protein [Aquibacillus sediminis]|uniref:TIGR02328 family protein n=1 Tax=Aquibacillus sediminis TaxID=2574734 RepID=UPI001108C620|nr:TIGR02328 family protein [Aquibacillus sediminis]